MPLILLSTILIFFIDRELVITRTLLALEQWYQLMIPALFPMMLFSTILVDIGTAHTIGKLIYPIIGRLFRVSYNGCYCMLAGLTMGFPMGAKTVCDFIKKGAICKEEGDYLLSFINCIGPMYTLHVTCSLFMHCNITLSMFAMYGLALLYGLILRYTIYRKNSFKHIHSNYAKKPFVDAFIDCIPSCGTSILQLGGYMVLFQLFFVTIQHLAMYIPFPTTLFYPLIEITGGLLLLPNTMPACLVLALTCFGGACCMIQTYYFIKDTPLSISKYLLNKVVLSSIVFITLFIFRKQI
ncbi:MAG: hypothetical protein R3Y47_04985 [Lachnospiraceae bacterium]